MEGGYSVEVAGRTDALDSATEAKVVFNFVALRDPNSRPPLEGPPAVLSIQPEPGSVDIDVLSEFRLEFSEPVLISRNVFLVDKRPKLARNCAFRRITGWGESSSSVTFKPNAALQGENIHTPAGSPVKTPRVRCWIKAMRPAMTKSSLSKPCTVFGGGPFSVQISVSEIALDQHAFTLRASESSRNA